jgi:hypothetical protein
MQRVFLRVPVAVKDGGGYTVGPYGGYKSN